MGAAKRRLPPALAANCWRPGQSGNPSGHSGEYGEAMRLARQAAPHAVRRLIELAEIDQVDDQGNLIPLSADADRRVVTVAANGLIDRAFGKPKDYDPAKDPEARPKTKFDPRLYSPEELEQIENVLRLLMEPRAVVERPEGAGPVRTRDRA
jgi:hypothetical protein